MLTSRKQRNDEPQAFVNKVLCFAFTNYTLLPKVDIGTIVRDIAKFIRWIFDRIAEHAGDPKRLFAMGNSTGAQLAGLIRIDKRYLKAEGLSRAIINGCVRVDGDTYDVPLMIGTSTALGKSESKFGPYQNIGRAIPTLPPKPSLLAPCSPEPASLGRSYRQLEMADCVRTEFMTHCLDQSLS